MSSETVYLTSEGKQALEAEVRELLAVRRPAIIDRIHDAQAHGDADDSGSHEEAKDELAQIDGRVREIENLLRHAELLPAPKGKSGKIQLGSHVVVHDDESGDTVEWMIVSGAEANSRAGKISNESLVGAALLGHKKGDAVPVKTPAGELIYTIVQVS